MSKNTSAANNWFVIHFWHWLGNQPLMNPVIPHLLGSIKTEPHKNSGVVHVYCWGQWHITCLIIRGPASSLSCGYATDGTIYQVLRELPVTSGSAPGTGWITVGCTRNIWKNCWGNALPVVISTTVLFSMTLTNSVSFCIFFHIDNLKLKLRSSTV